MDEEIGPILHDLSEKVKGFWPKIQEFMYMTRFPAIDQNKYQRDFFKDCGIEEEKGSENKMHNLTFSKRPRDPELDEER